jgi:CelD/BcsL family acetyltransferase involved in cellulose biosynthesis
LNSRPNVETRLITDENDFENLEPAWRKLESAGAIKDITVTWEWMSTWWDVFKYGRGLSILTFSEDGEIIGIAPFVSRKIKQFGLIPFRRVEFIASGEDERDEICSDYLDFIIRPGSESAVIDSLFSYLTHANDLAWDEVLLPRMLDSSTNIPLLQKLAKKHALILDEVNSIPCTYADLAESLDEYMSKLGRRTRKQIRRDINRLGEVGEVEFKMAASEDDIKRAKEILVDLHQTRWTQDGKPGVYASGKFQKFHDKIMAIAHEKGWLRLGTLTVNDEPLASEYNFRYRDKVYAYQCGVKIQEDSNISIGTIADVYAIGQAISEGLKEYDFLAGATYYKKRLTTNERSIVTLRIGKRSVKEAAFNAIRGLKRLKRKRANRGVSDDDGEGNP